MNTPFTRVFSPLNILLQSLFPVNGFCPILVCIMKRSTHSKRSPDSGSECQGDKGMVWTVSETARNRGSYDDALRMR